MTYTQAAVERAMKVHEVLMQALNGRQPWIQVAEVLGVSARTVRRLRWRYERDGFTGLYDHRHHTPSPRAVPLAEVQRILQLYRDRYGPRDGHPGFNVRHFLRRARDAHGVRFCYSFVKRALQGAGLVPKHRPRGRHRRRREPRPCFGELLHLDGSRHRWLALVPEQYLTLLVVVDDATKQVLYAELVDGGESTAAVMTALRAVLTTWGLPMALYTDRAHWAAHTPVAGGTADRTKLTQVGRALAQLGIEHILGYSPQARGRSERMNGTLQGRLVNELRAAGIVTVGRGQPLSARALPARLQCRVSPAAGRSRPGLRAPWPRRPRADPLPPRGARGCPRQYRGARRSAPAAREAARPPLVCWPPRSGSASPRWPPLRLARLAVPRALRCPRPRPDAGRGVINRRETGRIRPWGDSAPCVHAALGGCKVARAARGVPSQQAQRSNRGVEQKRSFHGVKQLRSDHVSTTADSWRLLATPGDDVPGRRHASADMPTPA